MAQFDCQKAADRIYAWMKNLWDTKPNKRKPGRSIYFNSFSECTGVIWRALSAGTGLTRLENGHASGWKDLASWMDKQTDLYVRKKASDVQSNPLIGDVLNYDRADHGSGHGVMYLDMGSNGKRWTSDFIQNGWNCYSNAAPVKGLEEIGAWRLKIPVVNAGKVIFNGDTGVGHTPTSSTNNTTTQNTTPLTVTAQPEPVDPNKNAGNVFENWAGNAYSNILGIDILGAKDVRRVKHTRIYALFNSTIVLDSLSELIDQANQEAEFEADKIIAEEQLKAVQNASQIQSTTEDITPSENNTTDTSSTTLADDKTTTTNNISNTLTNNETPTASELLTQQVVNQLQTTNNEQTDEDNLETLKTNMETAYKEYEKTTPNTRESTTAFLKYKIAEAAYKRVLAKLKKE